MCRPGCLSRFSHSGDFDSFWRLAMAAHVSQGATCVVRVVRKRQRGCPLCQEPLHLLYVIDYNRQRPAPRAASLSRSDSLLSRPVGTCSLPSDALDLWPFVPTILQLLCEPRRLSMGFI